MATFSYTKRAEKDLSKILTYTRERWGEAQPQRYLDRLASTLNMISENKHMGRIFSKAHPTWRRFEHDSHVIVYSPTRDGVRVQRLVHKNQVLEHKMR